LEVKGFLGTDEIIRQTEPNYVINESVLDALDIKVASVFPGRFVKKDLVRWVKAGAYIPVFVLEYLLSRYCSSTEKDIIEEGLVHVNEVIAERFVRQAFLKKMRSVAGEGKKRLWPFIFSVNISINLLHFLEQRLYV
jgi:ATP-dependent Lon protease